MNLVLKLLFLAGFVVIVNGDFSPEDSWSDDAEQLDRERRDSFFERILKTLPFFKISTPMAPRDDDEDNMDDERDSDLSNDISLPLTRESVPTIIPSLHMSTPSPSLTMTEIDRISATPTLQQTMNKTLTLIKTPFSTFYISKTTNFTLSASPSTTFASERNMVSSSFSVLPTIKPRSTIPVPTSTLHSVIMPTRSMNIIAPPQSIIIAHKVEEPIFQMMIVKEPELPDESGYGNVLAKAPPNNDESEIKSARFIYSTLFIPIMSGLFGALCITVVVMVIRCARRKRLRKIRYYGGKPESALYGLDRMGLLSDMSSDED